MLPYWLLFGLLALVALTRYAPAPTVGGGAATVRSAGPLPFVAVGLFLTAMIGLRYRVGGDWHTYLAMFERAELLTLRQQWQLGDAGYQSLNWIVQRGGGDMWLVNLICALIFVWGLVQLCRIQREPWLALLVAVPYCVIVVAMGYTRQATAMGLLMAGLAALLRGDAGLWRFAAYTVAAALFHKTAIVFFPLVVLAFPRSRLANLLIAVSVTALLYVLFLADQTDRLIENYISEAYQSQGAAVRLAQSALPAALFLLFRHRFDFAPLEERMWRNFAFASLLMVVLLFVLPSSTAVDRMSLYLLPLQFVILARLPGVMSSVMLGRVLVAAYLALSLYVWLNYAVHAEVWLPYRTWLEPGSRPF